MEPYLENFIKERVKGTSVEKKLRVIVGRAIDSLATLKTEEKQFDLIFIDADKNNYINYYKVSSHTKMHTVLEFRMHI